VYQEQVIDIFRKLGGFSLGQADMIRRAMSKKKQAEIVKERKAFIFGDPERNIPGAVQNGIPEDTAGSIYDEILDFANYAFNKAHAVSYAIVSYQTAYLKCHYPREYMAALMSSILDLPEKVAEYTAVCKEMGIDILPPDINESEDGFTVSGDNIRYGLVAVKNIGRGFIRSLMAERERDGRFTAFDELSTACTASTSTSGRWKISSAAAPLTVSATNAASLSESAARSSTVSARRSGKISRGRWISSAYSLRTVQHPGRRSSSRIYPSSRRASACGWSTRSRGCTSRGTPWTNTDPR
jgi:hypothetical protein